MGSVAVGLGPELTAAGALDEVKQASAQAYEPAEAGLTRLLACS